METPTSLSTPRLQIVPIQESDHAFIKALMNSPGWLRYIGDRKIRDMAAAQAYIHNNLRASYIKYGHGLMKLISSVNNNTVGICGLLQRDYLNAPDLGFAILPGYEGQGYIREGSSAILQHAKSAMGLSQVHAITTLDNHRCHHLLERLQFARIKEINPDDGKQTFLLYTAEL